MAKVAKPKQEVSNVPVAPFEGHVKSRVAKAVALVDRQGERLMMEI